MDSQFAAFFIDRWKTYFPGNELPICYFYADQVREEDVRETANKHRCLIGMFDVSARPCVPEHSLTFAVPMKRFEQMVHNMDESFLITESWSMVRSRGLG